MKKLLLSLLLLTTLSGFSQSSYYTAVSTALYQKYSWESEWSHKSGNDDVDISVSVTENYIHIDAQLATGLKLYGAGTSFNGVTKDTGTPFSGKTWKAYDVSKDVECTVDILSYRGSKYVVLGITYKGSPAVNLRYYLLKN